ncbi:MAG: hypothetical protein QOH91_2381, partial [Mycobacterium sp.]|nr:hypothetical protein [Mycobacterium sp.]
MTATTSPHPDIPLPDGTHVLMDWRETDNEYRIISTYRRRVGSTDVLVSGTASQLSDGSMIDIGADGNDAPLVFVD